MKIALLSKYSCLGASSRLRSMQYIPYLQKDGIEVQVLPLFDDTYLQKLYEGNGRSRVAVLGYYRKRVQALSKLENVDLVWLEKETFPYIPYWLERLVMPGNIPYVVDYDDAVFHNYDLSGSPLVQSVLGCKIEKVMANAAKVICGNDYLATRAKRAGAKQIEKLPTVVDVLKYDATPKKSNDKVTIGWIGSSTTTKYLKNIASFLRNICSNSCAEVLLIGAKRVDWLGPEVIMLDWSEVSEVDDIRRLDVGIMPLPDSPWERGKCGFKLIQYMACGLPVIASPVGVNKEIVEHGVNGFLASTENEWFQAFDALRNDSNLRYKMGLAGREKVEKQYSLQKTAPILSNIFKDVVGETL